METGLTFESETFLLDIYSVYKNRLKDGFPIEQAIEFHGDPFARLDEFIAAEPDADQYIKELSSQGFIKSDITGDFILTPAGINYIEGKLSERVKTTKSIIQLVFDFLRKMK